MKNRKGQALVEFVLILPIIIILLLGLIDIGRVFIHKSELENNVTDIINLYQSDKLSINGLKKEFAKRNIKVKVSKNETTDFITIEASSRLSFVTPFLKSYDFKVKRVLPYE